MLSQMLASLAFGFLHYTEMERGQHLYIHFANRNTVARFLLLHKLGGNLAHILLVQRRAAEESLNIGHGQDTPIAVVWLICDIVFRDSGQYVQRYAEWLDALDIRYFENQVILQKLPTDAVHRRNPSGGKEAPRGNASIDS